MTKNQSYVFWKSQSQHEIYRQLEQLAKSLLHQPRTKYSQILSILVYF